MANRDTGCDVAYGIWSAIEAYIEKPSALILGTFCDYIVAPVARLKFIEIPMVTSGALAYDFWRIRQKGHSDSDLDILSPPVGQMTGGQCPLIELISETGQWGPEKDKFAKTEQRLFYLISFFFLFISSEDIPTVTFDILSPPVGQMTGGQYTLIERYRRPDSGDQKVSLHSDSDLDILSPPVGQMMGGQCPLIEQISETGQWGPEKVSLWLVSCVLFY
ncbi:hypothetical protein CEXT_386991 [Caerostris extrusa]|uniref:Uncharacterized protein n=1 Tax=Caerostris extrusa TaxID=172846 RepID=A0AAV4TBX7_CAEEX|nr:hypothetical protein CEXT_386991 [Caerostris extrusa]